MNTATTKLSVLAGWRFALAGPGCARSAWAYDHDRQLAVASDAP